ncbi:MAG: hypothetical protein CL868_14900 [Cytophagaceae bacterium]|nr:hypothetical protein [Cytophagaceae bacterium]|tara:strand:- start:2563 stop:3123 length:561 start_codon:yes stop_codon:yes gene_type:complete
MEEIEKFIKAFSQEEAKNLDLLDQPDIKLYNSGVDNLKKYLDVPLYNSFGAKLKSPKPLFYYEKSKNKTPATTRILFRIDCYDHPEHENLYAVYLSNINPNGYNVYGNLLIITKIEGSFKIIASFVYTDRGSATGKKFYLHAGATTFAKKQGDYMIIDKDRLGKLNDTLKFTAPLDDPQSMLEYNK